MIWQAFQPDVKGIFHSRPNRFVALVETEAGLQRAHCPNPGRLRELLSPGVSVLLETPKIIVRPGLKSLPRSTQLSLAAVEHRGLWVPMASAKANQAAGLYLGECYPDWTLKPEYTLGHSRFDYCLTRGNQQILTEVKACTLEHSGVAMFPDAPSLRATKHLEHLGSLNQETAVLFVTYFPEAKSITPHLHTDPEFARAALKLQDKIRFQALVWEADVQGKARLIQSHLKVDLEPLRGIDYQQGLPLTAWESPRETIFAWGNDFSIWKKRLSQRSWVSAHLGNTYELTKVNDLRVFSHGNLKERWREESEDFLGALWVDGGDWKQLRVPGRPLDTQKFWEWFLSYRHKYWKQ